MIISFTGAQSTGKTTLLMKCKELYHDKYNFVDEVTRLVKRSYNVPINEDGTDITQMLILNKHIENIYNVYPETKDGVVLDRCIVDGLVYTAYLATEGKVSRWVLNTARNVFNLLVPKMDKIFYTHPGDVPLIEDGERSIDRDFRDKIINTFEVVFSQNRDILDGKLITLKGSVDQRIEQIKNNLC